MTGPTILPRPKTVSIEWNDALDRFVIESITRGFTTRETSQRVLDTYGLIVSRHSIIGRLHRLRFKNPNTRSEQVKRGMDVNKPPKSEIRDRKISISNSKPEPFHMPEDDPSLATISLAVARDFHCRWIVGDPKQKRTCANLAVKGCSYCILHARRILAS